MGDAWRPFSDEEMRKIIEGERLVVNGLKEDCMGVGVRKGPTRVFRGRPFKRVVNGRCKGDAEGCHAAAVVHPDLGLPPRASLGTPITKILEEEEEEDEGCELVEPVLRSDPVEVRRGSAPSLGEADGAAQHHPRGTAPRLDLDRFHSEQKKMEENNRLSKQLLHQALAHRAKKTREEAEKLSYIEEELRKLDSVLSCDVSIIRAQIEQASLQYLDAQKRYDKAEREYIGAKTNLYAYRERKELLTSHLCTIIERNELRKAHKLSDLMSQLEMPHPLAPPSAQKAEDKECSPGGSDERDPC